MNYIKKLKCLIQDVNSLFSKTPELDFDESTNILTSKYINGKTASTEISFGEVERTSELLNDGPDGVNPFITSQDLPTVAKEGLSVQDTNGTEQFKVDDFIKFKGIVFDDAEKQVSVTSLRFNTIFLSTTGDDGNFEENNKLRPARTLDAVWDYLYAQPEKGFGWTIYILSSGTFTLTRYNQALRGFNIYNETGAIISIESYFNVTDQWIFNFPKGKLRFRRTDTSQLLNTFKNSDTLSVKHDIDEVEFVNDSTGELFLARKVIRTLCVNSSFNYINWKTLTIQQGGWNIFDALLGDKVKVKIDTLINNTAVHGGAPTSAVHNLELGTYINNTTVNHRIDAKVGTIKEVISNSAFVGIRINNLMLTEDLYLTNAFLDVSQAGYNILEGNGYQINVNTNLSSQDIFSSHVGISGKDTAFGYSRTIANYVKNVRFNVEAGSLTPRITRADLRDETRIGNQFILENVEFNSTDPLVLLEIQNHFGNFADYQIIFRGVCKILNKTHLLVSGISGVVSQDLLVSENATIIHDFGQISSNSDIQTSIPNKGIQTSDDITEGFLNKFLLQAEREKLQNLPPHVTDYNSITEALTNENNTTKIVLNADVTEDVTGVEYNGRIEVAKGLHLDSNGVQISTYAEPKDRFIFGKEYAWSIGNKQMSNIRNVLEIICSGDSTTAGDNAQGHTPGFVINNFAKNAGVPAKVYNRGHSGSSTLGWNNSHVTNDINAYPNMDVYIARWGINDGGRGATRLADYKTALRSGLAKLRAFKGVDDLTIILQSPNSTSDTFAGRDYTSNRDERWYEEMIPIIRQAARDYQCVFVDTYAMFKDTRRDAAGLWMDNPFNDGRAVHPDKAFNYIIMQPVADVLFSQLQNETTKSNNFQNTGQGVRVVNESELSNIYPVGISMFTTGTGFPFEGLVLTHKGADGIVVQKLIQNSINENSLTDLRVLTRFSDRDANHVFSEWLESSQDLVLNTGFSSYVGNNYGAVKVRKNENGLVSLEGIVLKSINSNYGAVIGIMPVGYRPIKKKDIAVLTSTNAMGTTGTALRMGSIRLWANGDITVIDCDSYINLDNISFYNN